MHRRYADCRRRACVADLPEKYRVGPAESQRITEAQKRATRQFFDG
jgi:hypothetical protein